MPDNQNILSDPMKWVELYGDYLYNYAYQRLFDSASTEEIVQETFLAALKARSNFKGKSSEKTWLTSILRNKIFDYFRKSERIALNETNVDISDETRSFYQQSGNWRGHWDYRLAPSYWQETPFSLLENKEFQAVVDKCLEALPEKLGQILVLSIAEGMEIENICNNMNISSSNLRVRLHRARQLMRRCLDINWFRR